MIKEKQLGRQITSKTTLSESILAKRKKDDNSQSLKVVLRILLQLRKDERVKIWTEVCRVRAMTSF